LVLFYFIGSSLTSPKNTFSPIPLGKIAELTNNPNVTRKHILESNAENATEDCIYCATVGRKDEATEQDPHHVYYCTHTLHSFTGPYNYDWFKRSLAAGSLWGINGRCFFCLSSWDRSVHPHSIRECRDQGSDATGKAIKTFLAATAFDIFMVIAWKKELLERLGVDPSLVRNIQDWRSFLSTRSVENTKFHNINALVFVFHHMWNAGSLDSLSLGSPSCFTIATILIVSQSWSRAFSRWNAFMLTSSVFALAICCPSILRFLCYMTTLPTQDRMKPLYNFAH